MPGLKFWRYLIVAAVLGCHGLAAWALSGADVAWLVNQRYQQTPDHCFVDKTAYECSGVLMRTLPAGANGNFWQTSAAEKASGVARLDYVRRDIATSKLADTAGFIVKDRPTAIGNGDQPYDIVCGCPPPGTASPPCAACPGDPASVGVSAWTPGQTDTIPIEAIFYDVGNGGQLSQALVYQQQFYDQTTRWLPILRVMFGANGTTAFGYDERDQLYAGDAVAADLNRRYADTASVCADGRPAYDCNGVLVRITGWGNGFHSWNPSPTAIAKKGVSFAYVRADSLITVLIPSRNDAGMILRELGAPTQTPMAFRCIYPSDGRTDAAASDKCYRFFATFCAGRGITTVASWLNSYNQNNQCAFGPSADEFALSMAVRPHLPAAQIPQWNEVIIGVWPQDVPTQLPIEALFYVGTGTAGAQYIQQDYMATTGRFIPVVKIDLDAAPGRTFTYNAGEQSISPVGALSAPPEPLRDWGRATPD